MNSTQARGTRVRLKIMSTQTFWLLSFVSLFLVGGFRSIPAVPTVIEIAWSRGDLLSCVAHRCLHQKSFQKHRMSFEDAELSLRKIKRLLYMKPLFPPAFPQEFSDKAIRSTCAVIGGSPLSPHISATEQSRLVDETTDLVFRLNVRVPELLAAEGASPPLGKRTDAVFIQRGSLRSFERYIQGWGGQNASRGTLRKQAGEAFKAKWHPTMLFRHECPSRFESCPKAWHALARSSLPAWSDLHVLHYGLEMKTQMLLHDLNVRRNFSLATDVPTTGIVAIVTALHICKAVNVFMFNGSITGDGDVPTQDVWRGHNLKSERALLQWLGTCTGEEFEICGKLTIFS